MEEEEEEKKEEEEEQAEEEGEGEGDLIFFPSCPSLQTHLSSGSGMPRPSLAAT